MRYYNNNDIDLKKVVSIGNRLFNIFTVLFVVNTNGNEGKDVEKYSIHTN